MKIEIDIDTINQALLSLEYHGYRAEEEGEPVDPIWDAYQALKKAETLGVDKKPEERYYSKERYYYSDGEPGGVDQLKDEVAEGRKETYWER